MRGADAGGVQDPVVRVLVVDDHDLFRAGMASLLGAQPDIDVVAPASGGLRAVQLASQLRPDAVLVDLRMPDLDGSEATRAIIDRRPTTRVIALTVLSAEDVVAAVRAAASGSAWLSPRAADVVLGSPRQAHAGQNRRPAGRSIIGSTQSPVQPNERLGLRPSALIGYLHRREERVRDRGHGMGTVGTRNGDWPD